MIVSLLLILASLGFIVWRVYKVRSQVKGFKPMAKLLLGSDLQHPKFDENTAKQILLLLQSPISTVTHNITQPQPAMSTHPELVTRVPAALVTSKLIAQLEPVPPLPPSHGLMLPAKRILPAKSTKQITEALKEVMLELETMESMIKKYKKYLQKQAVKSMDLGQTKM